jgi:hypothetical protein
MEEVRSILTAAVIRGDLTRTSVETHVLSEPLRQRPDERLRTRDDARRHARLCGRLSWWSFAEASCIQSVSAAASNHSTPLSNNDVDPMPIRHQSEH